MSRENVEVLRSGIDALNRRDVDALAQLTHDQAEWRPALTAGGSLEGAVYRGQEGMLRYLSDLDAEFADTRMAVESLEAVGANQVFFRGRVTARGRASGINLDVPIWAVWELHEGKVLRGTAFLNEAEALEAVGLRDG